MSTFPRVTFNNQNTVLLSMLVPANTTIDEENHENLLCLLHNNRIFGFKKDSIDTKDCVASTSSNEQNIILNMLTTPKYRAMSAMYMLFHVLDVLMLLGIIALNLFPNRTLSPESPHMRTLNPDFGIVNICIYLAIGMEIFYDIMLNTNRYWLLQRLSIHIGITLYVMYGTLVGVAIALAKRDHPFDRVALDDLILILIILLIRFVSFVFEECVDIAIDFSLHNDVRSIYEEFANTQQHDLTLAESSNLLRIPSKLTYFTTVTNYIEIPENLNKQYQGSCFAWGTTSVRTKGVWKKDPISRNGIIALCFIPGIITGFLVSLLVLICFMAAIIPIMITFVFRFINHCCAEHKDREKQTMAFRSYWREMTYF